MVTLNDNSNYCEYFLEPTPITLDVSDLNNHSLNISWTAALPDTRSGSNIIPQEFSLTINSSEKRESIPQISSPYVIFRLPKDAPACEVYNFSVTATYVGATYTGAGCSEPSPVISRMLPSLPDESDLRSSLRYFQLVKSVKNSTRIILNILLEVKKSIQQLLYYIYSSILISLIT